MGGVPDEVAQKLSAREVEVLLLLDEHLGTDEIAARLYISEHTVRSHVKSLLRKLGVSSRREALERLATARTSTPPPTSHAHPTRRASALESATLQGSRHRLGGSDSSRRGDRDAVASRRYMNHAGSYEELAGVEPH